MTKEGIAEYEIRKCVKALQKADMPLHHVGANLVLAGSMLIGTVVPGLRKHFLEAFEIAAQILEEYDGSEADKSGDSTETSTDHGTDRQGAGEGSS